VRVRPDTSDRAKFEFISKKRSKIRNFDTSSFQWLSENYKKKNGLRDWTWGIMIKGLKIEHLHEIKRLGNNSEIDSKFVHIIWNMIL